MAKEAGTSMRAHCESVQGVHGGLTLDFVYFNSRVPPVCSFDVPSTCQRNLVSNHHGHPV